MMGLPKPLFNFHHFKTKITGEAFKDNLIQSPTWQMSQPKPL